MTPIQLLDDLEIGLSRFWTCIEFVLGKSLAKLKTINY